MSEAVARADDEIGKGIIGMQLRRGVVIAAWRGGLFVFGCAEVNADQMACNFLGGGCECALAVILQEADRCLVGAADEQCAAVEMLGGQVVEPFACVAGVDGLYAFDDIDENIFNFDSCQKSSSFVQSCLHK